VPAPSWGFTFGTDGEAIQYARPDSALYADARRLRARLGLRLDPRRGANTRIEATAERGWSPALPSEEYRELAGGAGVEWFGSGAWWELFARAGRRAPAGAALGIATGVPDGYRFYELEVGADQPLGAGLRLRVTANGRVEEHDDPSMDARSLYVSVELRWLAIPR